MIKQLAHPATGSAGHDEIIDQIAREVRTGLDLAGCPEVTIEKDWISVRNCFEDVTEFVTAVPIGKGHKLTLTASYDSTDEDAVGTMNGFTADLTLALPKIERARRSLLRYRALIAKAAWQCGQGINALGDGPILLNTTSFGDIVARRVPLLRWQDLPKTAGAVLNIRALGPDLRIEFRQIPVKSSEQVAAVLAPLGPEQRDRWRAWQRFHAPGSRFVVDEITIALLASFGFDPVTILRRFQDVPHFTLMVDWQGKQTRLSLTGHEKKVSCSIGLGNRVTWTGSNILIERSKYSKRVAPKVRAGQPAGAAVPHPVFHDRVVTHAETFNGSGFSNVHFDVKQYAFDADHGMLTLTSGQQAD